jgi:DNA-binding transcriptional LysR family regulator
MSTMDHYKVFYYAVKAGSLTKAAQQLFMTQPSASYAVKQLEEQLGVQLLARQAKGVNATEEGKVLYQFVEQAFGLLQAGERKIGEMKALEAGTVRIGASDSLCKHYLLPFLSQFRGSHPNIRIQLSHGKSEEIARRLTEGRIDCGIVHLPIDDRLHVQTIPIQDCFVAGPEWKHLAHRPIHLKEIVDCPFILLSSSSHTRRFFHSFLQLHGHEVLPDIELGSIDLLIEFVRNNMGISMITRQFVQSELASSSLFELKLIEPIPARSIGVATLPEGTASIASELFIQELIKHLSKFGTDNELYY